MWFDMSLRFEYLYKRKKIKQIIRTEFSSSPSCINLHYRRLGVQYLNPFFIRRLSHFILKITLITRCCELNFNSIKIPAFANFSLQFSNYSIALPTQSSLSKSLLMPYNQALMTVILLVVASCQYTTNRRT